MLTRKGGGSVIRVSEVAPKVIQLFFQSSSLVTLIVDYIDHSGNFCQHLFSGPTVRGPVVRGPTVRGPIVRGPTVRGSKEPPDTKQPVPSLKVGCKRPVNNFVKFWGGGPQSVTRKFPIVFFAVWSEIFSGTPMNSQIWATVENPSKFTKYQNHFYIIIQNFSS